MDAALQRCIIRIRNYASKTNGKGYKDVVDKFAKGITIPEELIKAIHGQTIKRVGQDVILGALTGVITEAVCEMIRQFRDEVALKDECLPKMDTLCRRWFPDESV